MTILLTAENMSVSDGTRPLLHPVTINLQTGEPLVVLGETGSGKSLLAQAIMGTLPQDLTATGRIALGSRTLNAAQPGDFRGLWGREIAVLPQEPWLSLDPLMRSGTQVAEVHALVRGLSAGVARTRAQEDFASLGLADAARKYPHQLSGGMAQRVAIAAARAGGAGIVVADEPTKGLDASRRDDVAGLLLGELGKGGGLLVITHDLELARRVGGRLLVLRDGKVVEQGRTADVLAAPSAAYTRELLAADPMTWAKRGGTALAGDPVIRTERLSVERGGQSLFHDLNFDVTPGQIFGVTGPSGCGKSTLGDAVLGLVVPSVGRVTKAAGLPRTAFQKLYQDPVAAFPRLRPLGKTIADIMDRQRVRSGRFEVLMKRLGLDPVLLDRRPDAVSGGELQRLSLLRILLLKPRFIFADEPTSRLDPITQAQVIGLLGEVTEEEGCAIMLVSHDAALIRNTADDVLALRGTGSAGDVAQWAAGTYKVKGDKEAQREQRVT